MNLSELRPQSLPEERAPVEGKLALLLDAMEFADLQNIWIDGVKKTKADDELVQQAINFYNHAKRAGEAGGLGAGMHNLDSAVTFAKQLGNVYISAIYLRKLQDSFEGILLPSEDMEKVIESLHIVSSFSETVQRLAKIKPLLDGIQALARAAKAQADQLPGKTAAAALRKLGVNYEAK